MQPDKIQNLIVEVRGEKVMLDFHLAAVYEVETRSMNQAVKRNPDRFPEDFMFQLSREEWNTLKSQFVISKTEKRGGTQKLPYAFTEHGVTMLASVLRSEKAVQMNLAIVRAFIAMRRFALNYSGILAEMAELQKTLGTHDEKLDQLFEALGLLLQEKAATEKQESEWARRERIGFKK
jgi:phage regulator Rha-like protein